MSRLTNAISSKDCSMVFVFLKSLIIFCKCLLKNMQTIFHCLVNSHNFAIKAKGDNFIRSCSLKKIQHLSITLKTRISNPYCYLSQIILYFNLLYIFKINILEPNFNITKQLLSIIFYTYYFIRFSVRNNILYN